MKLWRALSWVLWCGVTWALAWAGPASAQPAAARFRAPTLAAAVTLSADVLTPQERAFIAALPEVRVAIPQPSVQPYEVVGSDGEISGIHPEMLGYLARTFGLRIRPVLLPSFSAALEAVRRREADLMMTLGYTAARAEFLEFTLGVTPLPGALFARTGGPGGSDAALARTRFAVERDFLANDFIRRQYPNATIVAVETTDQALAAVAEGRADHYLGALLTTIDWLSRKPVQGIEIQRLLNYSSGYYHFAVRKDWAALVGVLNRGITTLRAHGISPAMQTPQWQAAIASLPQGMPLRESLRLDRGELALLAARPVWRIGAVRGLPLLNHVETDGAHSGIAAEFTEQVAQRLGIGVRVVPFANAGALIDGLRRGEVDVVPFMTRTPERLREFAFSRPYVEMPYVIVARSDAPLYWSLDSLRGRRLAIPSQHPLRPLVAERYPEIRLVVVDDSAQAMDRVAQGQADAAIEVKLLANQRIHADNDNRLRTVAVVEEVPAAFHFAAAGSQAGRAMVDLVDRALADIPGQEFDRMRRRWVAVDLDPPFPWRRHLPVIMVSAAAFLILATATAWWLRRLQREVAARRRSEERLRDIAATLPCVAFRHVFDAGGALKGSYVSPGAEALLGITQTPGSTILQSMAPRVRDDQRAAFEADAQRCRDRGEPLRATVAYTHPDGSERWLTCEAVATQAEGDARACTGFIVDVSKEQRLQQQLVEAAEARNLMLASASHELRAPAHTIALALQALPARVLDPAQRGALRIARDAVDTLSQLLGDVLDAARFDGAPLKLRAREFPLRELLQGVAESAAASAAAKGLAFDCTIDLALPERIVADPLRLKQVLTNLLSNAFKYTREGRVVLEAALAAEPGGERLRLRVVDTGPGIPAEQRPRLFTPFATAHAEPATPLPEGSSGLGLVICRRLARLMGGDIELASELGRGTAVTLTLPLRRAEQAAPPAPPRAGALLVCDDDVTSRLLILHLLQDRGFEVCEAATAEAALQRWRQGGVAALITDLDLPDLPGAQLIRRIHEASARPGAEGPARPLIVVCSGSAADPARPDEADTLADARFVKPVQLPDLLQLLASRGVLPRSEPEPAAAGLTGRSP